LLTPIKRIYIVGTRTGLQQKIWLKPWWSGHAGLITIDVPTEVMDQDMTVIAVELEGKLELEF
jgi:alpha-L-fucosidase